MNSFFENKVIVISGGTDGIGMSLVRILSAWGAKLAICGRNPQKIEIHKELFAHLPNIFFFHCDVKNSQSCKLFIQETVQKFSRIDILINNAGVSMRSEFIDTDIQVLENLIQTNLLGTIYLTHYSLPYLINSHGTLVGISSVAGLRGTPGRSGYSASKFAVTGFLESLRVELRHKINVLTVFPGFIASSIRTKALDGTGSNIGATTMQEKQLMSVDSCATHILHAVKNKRQRVIITMLGKITHILNKISPNLSDFLVYRFYYKNSKLVK